MIDRKHARENGLALVRLTALAAALGLAGACGGPGTDSPAPAQARPEAAWPVSREGLAFLMENASWKPAEVYAKVGDEPFYSTWSPKGLARRDRNFAVILGKGSFVVDRLAESLLSALKGAKGFSVEMYVTPDDLDQGGPAWIMCFASGEGAVNMRLGQEGSELVVTLRTSATDAKGVRASLGSLAHAEPFHLIVSYADGRLACYLNGKMSNAGTSIGGDLSAWSNLPLVFGAGDEPGHDWSGALEGIAMYVRPIKADEALRHYRSFAAKTAGRKPAERLEVQAKLLARSDIPEAWNILPYYQVVGIYEYEVEKVLAGSYSAKTIRAGHWCMLRQKKLPICEAPLGISRRLVLERMEDNPQLESDWRADTLRPDPEMPLYYDVTLPVAPDGWDAD